ncbi:PAS domain S-box protein [Pontibacter cellulosilyticus]|uniref:Sensory/regulatory protein RpfC n=1 Tax=Pontibacter cellulosilyticus TaxID=1720253 RepID=A0A923N350_9BACT|nr:PAS domain S-box protein [Pontibacter cellulosilyticus]MBC5991588.1 PAS domain S-box protein [Pontibacter cellulosilyticus]
MVYLLGEIGSEMNISKEIAALKQQLEQEKAARLKAEKITEAQAHVLENLILIEPITPFLGSNNTQHPIILKYNALHELLPLNKAAQDFLNTQVQDRLLAFKRLLQHKLYQFNNTSDSALHTSVSDNLYKLLVVPAYDDAGYILYLTDAQQTNSAANALQESRNFVKNIARTIPDIIYIYDLEESKNIYLNEHIKSILGYTDADVASISSEMLRALILPEDVVKLYRHVKQMQKTADGEVLEVEYKVRCKDGRIKNLLCRESVFRRNMQGEVKQIIGSAQDVTTLHQKSKELLRQKDFYESILNHIPSDVAVYNNKLEYLFLNPAAIKDPELRKWIIGKTNEDYSRYRGIPQERMKQRGAYLQRVLDEKALIEFEEAILDKEGKEQRFIRRLNPVLNDKSQVELVIGHGLNITELRKAQEEIVASEAKNRAILAAIPDLMFIINKDGYYLDMKNVDELHLTVPKDKVIGNHINQMLPQPLAEKLLRLIQRVVHTGQYEKTEYDIDFPDGTRYYEGRVLKYSDNEVLAIIRDNTEELKTAQEVQEKNDFIRQVVDSSPSLIFVKDAAGKFSFVNTECANLFGKSVNELVGASANTFYKHQDEPSFYNTVDKQVVEEGLVVKLEEKFTKPNGETVWLNTIKKPLFTSNGEVQVLGIATNITEQRQAKHRLEESEELFRLLSENSKDLISLHEPNGRYIYVSKACKELLGYEPEELIGSMPIDILHPEDIDLIGQKGNVNYLLEHKNILVQHRLLRKDGSVQWVETNIKPILNEAGEVVKIQSAVRDIEERKKAEEALKESEKKYRDLINYSRAYFCTHDMQGILQETNPYMLDMLGYTTDEMVGKNLKSFLPEHHQTNFNSYLREFRKKKLVEGIFTVLNKEQEERYLFYKNYKVEEPNTKPYIICIAQDITDRMHTEQQLKKAKEAAEESARVKENFLANMSHEIRTPMNGIMGMASLLNKSPLNQAQKNYIKIIQQSADNLLVIINDILDIAKIEAGKLELEEIPFNLTDTVKAAYQTLIYKAEEKELAYLIKPLHLKHQTVIGDPYRLNQVLLNLLNNAIKFTDAGSVTLSCSVLEENEEKLTLEFAVSDTGIGIPVDKRDYIFEGFAQAYSSTTRKYGGTGLGLSICRNLIEMQHGEIWVESEENHGSTFKFRLTYAKYNGNIDTPRKEDVDFTSLAGTKVLLAEDNEVNTFLAKSIMEGWDFEVEVARNGREAVEKAEQNTYDVILMDIQMPELSGLDATQLIRSSQDGTKAGIPIIALTANALKGDAEKYLSIGMNAYISKPFEEEELYLKIANILPHKVLSNRSASMKSIDKEENAPFAPLYDLSILHKMSRGNEAFIQRTKKLFIQTVPDTLSEIRVRQQQNDWAGVSAAAHKLKSTIDTLRIEKLKDVIRQIELGAKADEPNEAVEENIEFLQEVMAQVLQQMKTEV